MNIIGIDMSVNSPAVFKITYGKNYKQISIDYIAFTTILKISKLDPKIIYYKQEQFKDYIEKIIWFRNNIWNFLDIGNEHVVAFEGYAFGANGRIFNIAESTYSLKEKIYENGNAIKIYPPKTIKKFFANTGNASKDLMISTFNNSEFSDILKHIPDKNSPKEDLVDSFYVCKLLEYEMKLNDGIIDKADLNKKQYETMFYTTNKNKTILYDQKFLERG